MNDNQIIPIGIATACPLELALETVLHNIHSMINMGHVMHLNHPSKYRHVLVSIREMANEELYHLDRKAA